MTMLIRISRTIDRANDALGRVVSWLILLMVLLGAFNAIARYLGRFVGTNLSSNSYLEAQWYLFSLVFLLGAAHTLKHDKHVRVDVVYDRLSARHKAMVNLVGTLVILLPFCVFALWVSWPSVANSWVVWEQSPDPGGLPRPPIKTALLLGFALLFLQGVSEAIKAAVFLQGDAGEREEVAHER